jgi:hypothetical protein|tara:strand:+ start:302 stop:928 length:627 start_codon:yes stop_codon:yes gene_type:complete
VRISIKILESAKVIESRINQALVDKVNQKLRLGNTKAIQTARSYVKGWIAEQPEMRSIASGGDLAGEFGIRAGQGSSIATAIATAVSMATVFSFTPFNNKFKGSAKLEFQPDSFATLLTLPLGFTATKNSGNLHWMDWLLLQGNNTIIVGYEYVPDTGKGRSGMGTMSTGGMWRVPPQYAGTKDDNFITRAFLGREKQIAALFGEMLR